MAGEDIVIRRMNRDDMDLAVEWAAREGWNPGLHDAECFFNTDPRGFFVAEADGEPVGFISAVAYDEKFGFMGFYIVRNDLRHSGIGMKLWNTAISYMGNRTAGGDGVVEMLEKYEQCGFRIAHRNARFEGSGTSSAPSLTNLAEIPFPELERYDRRFFPAYRKSFLKSWITRPGSHGRACITAGRLSGYGVIRPCRSGYKIAPLFADNADIAEDIFLSLAAIAKDQPVYLDIPLCNQRALEMVERHGMKMVFETARIYRGEAPDLPLDDIYGITSFELG